MASARRRRGADLLSTSRSLGLAEQLRSASPLQHVIVMRETNDTPLPKAPIDYEALVASGDPGATNIPDLRRVGSGDDVLHVGTTGRPKASCIRIARSAFTHSAR